MNASDYKSYGQVPVWVLGEALMDCIAQPDGSLVPHLGGSPYNLACATAKQGAHVGFIAPFSIDVFGKLLLDHLTQSHVRSLLRRSVLPTSLAVVQLHHGQPSYGFYRDGVADRDYEVVDVVTLLKSSEPGVLHTGSLMALPPEHYKVLQVISQAKHLGWVISVDVNLRPRVATDLPAYLQAVREIAAQADWLKASDEDLTLLGFSNVSYDRAVELASHWTAQGTSRVALTFGAQGAYLQVGSAHAQEAAPQIQVKDTVGAGDTFWGNCLADWVKPDIWQRDNVAAQRVSMTLKRALAAAAINCSLAGCVPPDAEAVNAFMNSQNELVK